MNNTKIANKLTAKEEMADEPELYSSIENNNQSIHPRQQLSQSETDSPRPVFIYKIVVIGGQKVGKSKLIETIINQPSIRSQKHSQGIEFKSLIVPVHGYAIKAEFWDTPGDVQYRKECARLCSDLATAFVICFSLTDSESYHNMNQIVSAYDLLDQKEMRFRRPTLVVGTKLDDIVQDSGTAPNNLLQGFKLLYTGNDDTSGNKHRQVEYDHARLWSTDRGGEYIEYGKLLDTSIIPNFVKRITNQLPTGIHSDAQALIALRVYPVLPLLHVGRHIEYKNLKEIKQCIDDCSEMLDWI